MQLVMGTGGMVAAAHPLAAEAGLAVLRAGGNAVDAAITTNAVLNVTQPDMCGIGGDFFALIHVPGGETVFLNGSGRAPAAGFARGLCGTLLADDPPLRACCR